MQKENTFEFGNRIRKTKANRCQRLCPWSQISHLPGVCAKSAEVLKVLPYNFSKKMQTCGHLPKRFDNIWHKNAESFLSWHDSYDCRILGTESEEVSWLVGEISLSCVLFAAWKIWACHGEVRWMLENSYQYGLRLGSCSVSQPQNISMYIEHIRAYCGILEHTL